PEYDPYDLDIKLKEKLNDAPSNKKDSIRTDAVDVTTIKTINLTNVKKNKTNNKKAKVWDISNLDLNYSHTVQERHNPLIESEEIRRTRGAVGYSFAPQPRFIEPLKKLIKSNSKWLTLIRDFNINYSPSLFSVRADIFRQFGAVRPRNVGGDGKYQIPETYDKYFTFDRYYTMRWELTRSITIDYNALNNARIDEPFGRIDTKEKKAEVRDNFFKGGRNTHYHQDVSFSYNVPMQKIPMLDWINVRASYIAKYDWIGASLLAKNLGNTLLNGQTKNLNADFNFDQLYNKSRLLRALTSDIPVRNTNQKQTKTDTTTKKKIKDPNQPMQIAGVPKFFGRMLTSLKRIGVQYTEDLGTLLPGYLDSTKILGQDWNSRAPGFGFIFGGQPDTNKINNFGARGLLTRDPIFNELIQQRYNQKLSITAQLTPIRDLNIDVNLDKTFDKQYSELFKDTSGTAGLRRFNPYALGSFSISYISYQTLFTKFDPNQVSETFKQFEANRALLSSRLSKLNPYPGNDVLDPKDPDFYVGYGRYSQDILIPAFIAAYTNKDPLKIGLLKNNNPKLHSNPFSNLVPRPNWNITYTGLSRIPGMEKIFTNFTIRHGYNSTLSMNSFNTGLLFQDPFRIGFPFFVDTMTHSYIPYFLVPNITISEAFTPLIELDMTFANQLSTRFEFKKSRQLSLSLIDYQLAENRSTEFTVGMNWRKRGVPIIKNINIGKKGMKLDNDVTFRFDFSLRDDATANSKLDQNTAFGTAGQKVIRIAPSIDYVLNSKVNVKLYFEQNRVLPKISSSFPITNTRAGMQIRISLAQ
ncbi:MAG: cell surface protein SprA, partial [Bacteroidota bacterium]|nr:cell surface protein SprA [Bacteroidota bacterium]